MVRNGKIALVELFKSIDGEGFHAGQPAVFIRTFGCNLHCSYCDTMYAVTKEDFKKTFRKGMLGLKWRSVEEIVEETEELAKGFVYKSVCLTGGEPLLECNKEFMFKLVAELVRRDFAVNIETNGAVDYSEYKARFPMGFPLDLYGNRRGVSLIMDWKLPGSGMNDRMLENNLRLLNCWDVVKFVISDDEKDWEEMERVCKLCSDIPNSPKKYISPIFGKVTMQKIPEWIMKHPQYNAVAQLQLHKYFYAPDTIGV